MYRKGITLIECLLSLALSAFIVLGSLEFFGVAKSFFFRQKTHEEMRLGVWAAMSKIRTDILSAGAGLGEPLRLGLVEGAESDVQHLLLQRAEFSVALAGDIAEGQTVIPVSSEKCIPTGGKAVLFDGVKGEVREISASGIGFLKLATPSEFSYQQQEASCTILEEVILYRDTKGVLRRKVNTTPAQPLLEGVTRADFQFERQKNLLHVRLILESRSEKIYEATFFAKNMALAPPRP